MIACALHRMESLDVSQILRPLLLNHIVLMKQFIHPVANNLQRVDRLAQSLRGEVLAVLFFLPRKRLMKQHRDSFGQAFGACHPARLRNEQIRHLHQLVDLARKAQNPDVRMLEPGLFSISSRPLSLLPRQNMIWTSSRHRVRNSCTTSSFIMPQPPPITSTVGISDSLNRSLISFCSDASRSRDGSECR